MGRIGFRFKQDVIAKNATWKKILQETMKLVDGTPFTLDSTGHLFLPFRLDAEELAAALREQSVADALHPFRVALDQLVASQPAMDQLLEGVEKSASQTG